jgi:hypothetical protein
MPDQTRRISPDTLTQDIQSWNGLQAIHTYHPPRPEASLETLQRAYQTMLMHQQLLVEKQAAYKAASDAVKRSEWAFHDAVLAMKDAVRGQYGADSNEVQTIGFKKKSQRKRPTKPKAAVDKTNPVEAIA